MSKRHPDTVLSNDDLVLPDNIHIRLRTMETLKEKSWNANTHLPLLMRSCALTHWLRTAQSLYSSWITVEKHSENIINTTELIDKNFTYLFL